MLFNVFFSTNQTIETEKSKRKKTLIKFKISLTKTSHIISILTFKM